jgi:hypothetical protein
MKKFFKYKCSTCGETHGFFPSFSFKFPSYYIDNKKENQYLNDDFCVVDNDYFIRVLLEIPIV